MRFSILTFVLLLTHGMTAYSVYERYNKPNGILSGAVILLNDQSVLENVDATQSTIVISPDLRSVTLKNGRLGNVVADGKIVKDINDLSRIIKDRPKRFSHNKYDDI